MSIERSYGEVEFYCDNPICHEVFETETKDWAKALELFKASDWALRWENSEALHVCPDCIAAETPGNPAL